MSGKLTFRHAHVQKGSVGSRSGTVVSGRGVALCRGFTRARIPNRAGLSNRFPSEGRAQLRRPPRINCLRGETEYSAPTGNHRRCCPLHCPLEVADLQVNDLLRREKYCHNGGDGSSRTGRDGGGNRPLSPPLPSPSRSQKSLQIGLNLAQGAGVTLLWGRRSAALAFLQTRSTATTGHGHRQLQLQHLTWGAASADRCPGDQRRRWRP
jgi:hypothetical protein